MTNTHFGGDWTGEKLEILERYLDRYTTALKNRGFQLIYVDAFAGEGTWSPRTQSESQDQYSMFGYSHEDYGDFEGLRDGSARIALRIKDKPFDKFIFIEKDTERCEKLDEIKKEFPNCSIEINNTDANTALISFCDNLENYERAVVFLDPFATQVSWETVAGIAATKKIDCWILFPLSAIARQMPRDQTPTDILASNLDRIFGGRSHWQALYQPSQQLSMLGDEPELERPAGSGRIADNYRSRLEKVFEKVAPTRRVFKNSRNSPMFELFFAASNRRGAPIAIDIADYILKRW